MIPRHCDAVVNRGTEPFGSDLAEVAGPGRRYQISKFLVYPRLLRVATLGRDERMPEWRRALHVDVRSNRHLPEVNRKRCPSASAMPNVRATLDSSLGRSSIVGGNLHRTSGALRFQHTCDECVALRRVCERQRLKFGCVRYRSRHWRSNHSWRSLRGRF